MRAPDLQKRRRELLDRFDRERDPDLQLEAAFLEYMIHDFDAGLATAQAAYRGLRHQGRNRRAALAAAAVGRIYFEGLNNHAAARGWFARGRTMLADEGECVERGWVELGLVGCSITDVGALATKAAEAVKLARKFDDLDLECKALADQGLALVTLGRINEGMELIDEAMAILSSGEVHSFAAGQVSCCTLTACDRVGDVARADAWLRVLEEAGISTNDQQTSILFAHCQAVYGNLLCQVGRWGDAEAALTLSLTAGRNGFYLQRAMARASLADLRLRQGRLQEAEQLLAACGDRWEAIPTRAKLHYVRGEFEHAVSSLKQALRQIGEDRVRAVPLMALLANAEIARGDTDAAGRAAGNADRLARETRSPVLMGEAALAMGNVLSAAGKLGPAVAALEAGLQVVASIENLLIKGALHLALARLLADSDSAAAVTEARTALAIYERLDAPEAEVCATLLKRIGVAVSYSPRPAADPLAPLTRREREIVQLIGQGLTNAQIAEKLFISPKTAEHHVSNILGKLALRSRFEVAAMITPTRK
ncbi:MAG: LuxR C-terminal-related transcriptional regulator [Candidatus Dormibacteraeota bacterium]|nr:LuxR C-terminal-related transcriptional regulator [Candidatus Dormibacteraeota bacterium]